MEPVEPEVIEVEENQEGVWDMKTAMENEELFKALERQKRLKNGLKAIAVVGVGAGLYGFKLGRQYGLRRGVDIGYVAAGQDFIKAFKEYTEELKLSRGE